MTTKTTELYSTFANKFIRGPDLPYPVRSHSIVKISETQFALIGGFTSEPISTVMIYDITNHRWTKMPDLINAMHDHSCGMAMSSQKKQLVCAKGNTVNIFDFMDNKWTVGSNIPQPVHHSAPVLPYGDTFLIVGGGSKVIQEYQPATMGWKVRSEMLAWDRNFQNAVIVPERTLKCMMAADEDTTTDAPTDVKRRRPIISYKYSYERN